MSSALWLGVVLIFVGLAVIIVADHFDSPLCVQDSKVGDGACVETASDRRATLVAGALVLGTGVLFALIGLRYSER